MSVATDPNYQAAVTAAFAELKRRLAPAVLAESDDNVIVLRNYLTKRSLSAANADHLYQAITELDAKELIQWQVPPVVVDPQVEAAEKAAAKARRLDAKQQQDYFNSTHGVDVKVETVDRRKKQLADAEKKKQDDAQNEINRLKSTYIKGHPSGHDYSGTAAGRSALEKAEIIAKAKGLDNVGALAEVNRVWVTLP